MELVRLWLKACAFFISLFITCGVYGFSTNIENETKADYWRRLGLRTLRSAMDLKYIESKAKNIIFFLGDGMGIPSVTAIRIYKGQKAGKSGEEEILSFDEFPFVSLAKTYALDRQNPDSANTATAYLCGVKANYGTIGVDGRVMLDDCTSSLNNATHVNSILQWAQKAGKSTGVVTTTRITHATPAGAYAHAASRNWEANVPDDRCTDIATQLVHHTPGKDINVLFGGGRSAFIPSIETDNEGMWGVRNDTKNLLNEWLLKKQAQGLKSKSVFSKEEFDEIKPEDVDYVLGLFSADHIPYVADRPDLKEKVPSLVELTEKAISILSKNPKGYFLLVEGGRIDTAHHDNFALRALEEGVEFDKAIQTAVDKTNIEDTLIIVTADHSHTFTIGGDYPKRGSNILGLGGVSDINNSTITIITYGNGPGYVKSLTNLTEDEVVQKNYQQHAAFPLSMETHGAEDVAVYARGPMAHLLHGVYEQSYIPYVMGYASCIGPSQDLCSGAASTNAFSLTKLNILWLNILILLLFLHSMNFVKLN